MDVLQGGVVSTSPNPLSWRTTPCRLSTTAYSIDNEMYLLIKYIKSFLWRAAKRLSYTEDARCLKVKGPLL